MHRNRKTLIIQTAVPREFAGIYDTAIQQFCWQSLEGKNLEALCGVDVPADLDALAVAVGPGRFSSTRVGVGFAFGLSFARGLPIAALDVFDLMDNVENGWYLITSRKDEFYASYRQNSMEIRRTILETVPEDTVRIVDKEHPLGCEDVERYVLSHNGFSFSSDWQSLRVAYMKDVAEEYKLWK